MTEQLNTRSATFFEPGNLPDKFRFTVWTCTFCKSYLFSTLRWCAPSLSLR